MPGRSVDEGGVDDAVAFAEDLAGFLRALQGADATGGPAAGEHSFYRGADPAYYDAETREAIGRLGVRIDSSRATSIWEEGLAATWTGAPVWFHGDVAAGNLLVRDGRLSAVIDFGTSGVGDPACDLYIAWTFLRGRSRAGLPRGARVRRRDVGARPGVDALEGADHVARRQGRSALDV